LRRADARLRPYPSAFARRHLHRAHALRRRHLLPLLQPPLRRGAPPGRADDRRELPPPPGRLRGGGWRELEHALRPRLHGARRRGPAQRRPAQLESVVPRQLETGAGGATAAVGRARPANRARAPGPGPTPAVPRTAPSPAPST